MTEVRELQVNEYNLWQKFVNESSESNVFQSIEYYNALKVLKWDYKIVVVTEHKAIVAGCIVQVRKLPVINRYFSVLNYGPIVQSTLDYNLYLNKILDYLRRKSLYLELNVLNKENISLKNVDYVHTGSNKTFIIDLKQDLEVIFSKFSKTNRNCVRKAEKEGVIVTFSQSLEDAKAFIDMYQLMIERKQIETIDINFLKTAIYELVSNHRGFIAIAKYDDVVYNMAVVGTTGKTGRYLWGASIHAEKSIPPIGQALHHEIIKKLIEDQLDYYDLGGIPEEELTEEHPNYGVWKFKKGFGGEFKVLTQNYKIYFSKLIKLLKVR